MVWYCILVIVWYWIHVYGMVLDPDIRQHDFRLELDRHEIVRTCDAEFIVIKKLVESMLLAPGRLTFTPCDGWKVHILRYKRQSTFLLEDSFMVIISDVKEYCVNWENYSMRNEGDQLIVNLEDFQDCRYWELKVYSGGWRGMHEQSIFFKLPSVWVYVDCIHWCIFRTTNVHHDAQMVVLKVIMQQLVVYSLMGTLCSF